MQACFNVTTPPRPSAWPPEILLVNASRFLPLCWVNQRETTPRKDTTRRNVLRYRWRIVMKCTKEFMNDEKGRERQILLPKVSHECCSISSLYCLPSRCCFVCCWFILAQSYLLDHERHHKSSNIFKENNKMEIAKDFLNKAQMLTTKFRLMKQ